MSVVQIEISIHRNKLRFVLYIKLTRNWFKICILIYCLCYCAILLQTEYGEFASIAGVRFAGVRSVIPVINED